VESNLCLLDKSGSLESVIEDFKLFNCQVPINFDYNTLDAYASGRKAGHLGSSLCQLEALPMTNDKVSLLLGSITARSGVIPNRPADLSQGQY
jgi:hypothetical protein